MRILSWALDVESLSVCHSDYFEEWDQVGARREAEKVALVVDRFSGVQLTLKSDRRFYVRKVRKA